MSGLSVSEILLYGGLAVMAAAAAGAIVCAVVFVCTGRRIKEKLEQEYGRLGR